MQDVLHYKSFRTALDKSFLQDFLQDYSTMNYILQDLSVLKDIILDISYRMQMFL